MDAKKVHENKLKRSGKLEKVKLITVDEAKARLAQWNSKSDEQRVQKKTLVSRWYSCLIIFVELTILKLCLTSDSMGPVKELLFRNTL